MFHLLKLAQTVVKTREDVYAEFYSQVNLSAQELENWLKTATSKIPDEGSELELIIDKKISRKVARILRKKKYMLTKGDYAGMEQVSNAIQNIYQKKPRADISESNWRYALMNLGHDPEKQPQVNS
ncbi:MAG: DNA-binding protein [Cytophagales bacterium CG18_big_fil_WC_8_21_14_2_50_42_9]|nr:MAG: DNA-binding protein [Cytophagales bacterium CG18_big_fil_WC_8_21_14_2_50_42_9]